MSQSNDIIALALTKFLTANSLEEKLAILKEQQKILLSEAASNRLIAVMKQYEQSNDKQQKVMAQFLDVHLDFLLTAGMIGVTNAWMMFAQELKSAMEKKASLSTENKYAPDNVVKEIIKETQQGDPERAILLAEGALQYFNIHENDPQQRAFFQFLLADAYIERVMEDKRENIEQAIRYYQKALSVFTRDHSLEHWAAIQHALGEAYTKRIAGEIRDNLEQAITHFEAALFFYSRNDFPKQWAGIQGGLGDLYQKRIADVKRDNLERAIACYEEALQVFTRQRFPPQWAATQRGLGDAYINRIAGVQRTNQEMAISHFQAALQVFTRESFPKQWANTQMSLGDIYQSRIEGTSQDNLERAITHYEAVLQVYIRDRFPYEWGKAQLNLGNAYALRITGKLKANSEQAIICYKAALQVHTREYSPRDWIIAQIGLSTIYLQRIEGESQDNIEHAIACCKATLAVCTKESFPTGWAHIQENLGRALVDRALGDRRDNQEQAIACYEKALQVYTYDAFPREWAGAQMNLGGIYRKRIDGEKSANREQANIFYQKALQVFTIEAFPSNYRKIQLNVARIEEERQQWAAVHKACACANEAEDLLVRLGAGAQGRDTILEEGRNASIREGFALTRLEKAELAAIAIERGRARDLAETLALDAADPRRITDRQRRERYILTRQQFIDAQAVLNKPLSSNFHERDKRQIRLQYVEDFHTAQKTFNDVIDEIHRAKDPVDFLNDTFDAATILQASRCGGAGHALVYLLATHWGGVAIAASHAFSTLQPQNHFLMLDLPGLTEYFLADLLRGEISEEGKLVVHDFSTLQRSASFSLFLQSRFSGNTLHEQATALIRTRKKNDIPSTLIVITQKILQMAALTALLNQPFSQMTDRDKNLLDTTFSHCLLQLELKRSLEVLSDVVIRPLMAWLKKQNITSLTLIPCGYLPAFPLMAVRLADGRTLGETIPTSIAPSARSLLQDNGPQKANRSGVYAIGDPRPTRQELHWGEAEALTIAKLAKTLQVYGGGQVKVQKEATSEWFSDALQQGKIVDASCHGTFDTENFLQSALLLAGHKRLPLGSLLSHEVDLRGLRLLILSACQTAVLDLNGAVNEVRSLAVGVLQSGARAVLASLWSVDDRATYLLMVRFAQEWFPNIHDEPPATALARAQHWLRTVTNRELLEWEATRIPVITAEERQEAGAEVKQQEEMQALIGEKKVVAVRGRGNRYEIDQAVKEVRRMAKQEVDLDACPYADPIYWAAFQVTGW